MHQTAITPDTVGAVLAGLGLARALDAASLWQDGRLWIDAPPEDAAAYIAHDWAPPAVVSPWNSGTALFGGKARAEPLSRLRAAQNPRLWPLREAYAFSGAWSEPPEKGGDKDDLILACAWSGLSDLEVWTAACWRREPTTRAPRRRSDKVGRPSGKVAQVDRLGGRGELTPHQDLGSGGNFGRLDLADVMLGAVARTLATEGSKERGGEAYVATAWITGGPWVDPGDPYADSAGPLFAGRATAVSPWEYMLAVEGAMALGALTPDWWAGGAEGRPWMQVEYALDEDGPPDLSSVLRAAADPSAGDLRRFQLLDMGNGVTRHYAARLWGTPLGWADAAATLVGTLVWTDDETADGEAVQQVRAILAGGEAEYSANSVIIA